MTRGRNMSSTGPSTPLSQSPLRGVGNTTSQVVSSPPPGSPGALFNADRDSILSAMLERNCSVGKGRRSGADLNAFASVLDERVERNGGKEPFLIGVAGGTASGKTTVCDLIMHNLQEKRVVLIAQDSFYRGLTQEEHDNVSSYNFDHPDAIDVAALVETLRNLALRNEVKVPIYDFVTHSRKEDESVTVEPADVIIVEGILVLAMAEVRELCHMKIFVDTDDDLRLARRLKRDTVDRGRSVDGVITQYTTFVKPMFDTFVSPSKRHADVIIPWAQGENNVAIDLIVQHIRTKLGQNDLRRIYPNLIVLPPNFQIRGMHTIIRSQTCNRSDFVFYSDRLIRLVVEHALGHLPFRNEIVTTPNGDRYNGVTFSKKICGVALIRSGEAMENALRACCKGIKIGKILVARRDNDGLPSSLSGHRLSSASQSTTPNPGVRSVSRVAMEAAIDSPSSHLPERENGTRSGEGSPTLPRVVYEKLPADINDRYVLLLDPILATGVSSMAAIDRLIKAGVRQDRIMFVTIIAASQGIHSLCMRYPHMKIITSEVDAGLNDQNRVVPGVGEFGDRYFGTEDMQAYYDGDIDEELHFE